MRVALVSAVFPPEPLTTAMTSSDLAEELARRGHDVIVVSPFPNRPSGRLRPGVRRRLRAEESQAGVRVVHTWHTLSSTSSLASRGLENLSFGLTSAVQVACGARPDVAYVNTWPILAQSLARMAFAARGVPVVLSVQDIYPESLLGRADSGAYAAMARAMAMIDSATLRSSQRVIVISAGMRDFLVEQRGLDPALVEVVPNWLDERRFPAGLPRENDFRRSHGIGPEKFVAMFAGSLTQAAGLELYLEAAELLRNEPDFLLLLVGDGSRRLALEREIARRSIRNLRVVHPLLPDDVPLVQASADVLLLSLTGDTAQSAAPSKQIAYMLSARPIIASVRDDSPPARILRRADAGLVVPQGDPQAVTRAIRTCIAHPDQARKKGENGRRFALAELSRAAVLPRLAGIVEQVGTLHAHGRVVPA